MCVSKLGPSKWVRFLLGNIPPPKGFPPNTQTPISCLLEFMEYTNPYVISSTTYNTLGFPLTLPKNRPPPKKESLPRLRKNKQQKPKGPCPASGVVKNETNGPPQVMQQRLVTPEEFTDGQSREQQLGAGNGATCGKPGLSWDLSMVWSWMEVELDVELDGGRALQVEVLSR